MRGANHAPQVFEECLDGIEGVRTGCAVAVGHVPVGGDDEELLLLVETMHPAIALKDRIVAAVVERTGIRPHTVELLEPGTLPRTSSGKLRRGEALRRYVAGALEPPKAVNALSVGAEIAKGMLSLARTRLKP